MGRLREWELPSDPMILFQDWFEEAGDAGNGMPEAMTLATADCQGRPSARMVLLKGTDAGGFIFFTNYESRKSAQLAENPQAGLVFWWPETRKQVRASGTVQKLSEADSDAYFQSRPRHSQIGAWTSPQSQEIENRAFLETRFRDLEVKYAGQPIPRPSHWGGFRVDADRIEFWEEQPHRLHDRWVFTKDGDQWHTARLAP